MISILGIVTTIGAACFGLVMGWIVHRVLRRALGRGPGDLAAVTGGIAGAAVMVLLPLPTGAFGAYCVGLAVGIFAGARAASIDPANEKKSDFEWLGGSPSPRPGQAAGRSGSVFASSSADRATVSQTDRYGDAGDGPIALGRAALSGISSLLRHFRSSRVMMVRTGGGGGTIVLDSEPSGPPPGPARRVLNANFAEPPAVVGAPGRVVPSSEGLVVGRDYDLLVDVGPKWEHIASLVTGLAAFPEDALPPDPEGHEIQVVVVGEEFEPRSASGTIWLPARSGPSVPMVDGVRSGEPGPLRLRLRVPARADGAGVPAVAWGRLSLYYENNLLQSAVIRAGVVSEPEEVSGVANGFEADFVLSRTFRDLEALKYRKLDLGPEGPRDVPVALNVTMNRDASGRHRIVIKGSKLPMGWMAYDPEDAKDVLGEVREALTACYCERDPVTGVVRLDPEHRPRIGLDRATLRRPIEAFKWDLKALAEVGSDLFDRIFLQVSPDGLGPGDTMKWAWDLRHEALANSAVIQVARTNLANHVFPWGLVYQHPLDKGSVSKFCPIVEEWGSGDADRSAELAKRTRCKYEDDLDHDENIICPYGFWGLRHIVEQPPTELENPDELDSPVPIDRRVRLQPPVTLGVAVAADPKFDPGTIADHLRWLGTLSPLAFSPPAAGTWSDVRSMLKSPSVAYFLCHDAWDEARGDSYLGLGPIDAGGPQRIYVKDLIAWVRKQDPGQWAWWKRRPLVFINACHSADLRPGQVLNFVPTFARAGASGVIGTEVSVWLPVAVAAGQSLLEKLAAGRKVGEAMRAMRWELASRGNLLGLAYTMYCMADVELVNEPALVPAEAATAPP